jgi:hypothetical protein
VTLSGGGHVNLNNSASNIIIGASGAAAFDNVDNHIAGAGDIGDGKLAITNAASGIINGTQATELILDAGANTILNDGLIANSGSGGTVIQSAVENDGTLNSVSGGALTVNGAVSGTGAARVNTGSTIEFGSTFNQDLTLTGLSGTVIMADAEDYKGTFDVRLSNQNKFYIVDARDVVFSGSTTSGGGGFNGAGVITMSDGTHNVAIGVLMPSRGDFMSVGAPQSDGHGGTEVQVSVEGGAFASASRFVTHVVSFAPAAESMTSGFREPGRMALPIAGLIHSP